MSNTNIQKNCRIPGITYQEYLDMAVAEWSKYQKDGFTDVDKAVFTSYAVETVWNATEHCRTHNGAMKKIKELKITLPESENIVQFLFDRAIDLLLCVDILFSYDFDEDVLGLYCRRILSLVPKEYKKECEYLFIEKIRQKIAVGKHTVK